MSSKGRDPGVPQRRSFTAPALQKQCDEWNRLYPVGTEVVRTDGRGEERLTTTRIPAVSIKGLAVIQVVDMPGVTVLLDRIRPRKCRCCGCTTFRPCRAPLDFTACHWVKPDLCSACLGKEVKP